MYYIHVTVMFLWTQVPFANMGGIQKQRCGSPVLAVVEPKTCQKFGEQSHSYSCYPFVLTETVDPWNTVRFAIFPPQ